jgi:chemotaxis signal transduction protein
MMTVVEFRTSGGRYCVPVDAAIGVRPASGLVELPAPRAGVVGILPDEHPITVLSLLGGGCDQVLVMAAEGHTFGLLVEEVTGLSSIDEADIGVAPEGQDEAFVSGVISRECGLVLLADPAALAGRL